MLRLKEKDSPTIDMKVKDRPTIIYVRGEGGVRGFFVVTYTATGAITNIDPVTVTYADGQFSVPLGVTEFTFEDDGVGMTATFDGTNWEILITDVLNLTNAYITHVESEDGVVDRSTVLSIYEEILTDPNWYLLASYCDLKAGKKLAVGHTDRYQGLFDMIYPYRYLPVSLDRVFTVDSNGMAGYPAGAIGDFRLPLLAPDFSYLNQNGALNAELIIKARIGNVGGNRDFLRIYTDDNVSVITSQIRASRRARTYIRGVGGVLTLEPTGVAAVGSDYECRIIAENNVKVQVDFAGSTLSINVTTQGAWKLPGNGYNTVNLAYIEEFNLYSWKIYGNYNPLVGDYYTYLLRDDIDNLETNGVIDDTANYAPEYILQSFHCAKPMDNNIPRRAFPSVHKYGDYYFMTYQAGASHSPNASKPYVIELLRSTDMFQTSEVMPVTCVDDGGIMRAIDPATDDFAVWHWSLGYADSKLWIYFTTFLIVGGVADLNGKTYITSSADLGVTWTEMQEISATIHTAMAIKPVIVGDEIWWPCYRLGECFVLKYNYTTSLVSSIDSISGGYTNYSCAEPAILEYATGKYMCAIRVTSNDNFPEAPNSNRGLIISYSTDGIDWSDFTFYNWGAQYPNSPKLFQYGDWVYLTRENTAYYGKVAVDESEIVWYNKSGAEGLVNWNVNTFYAEGLGFLNRKDPRTGKETDLVDLNRQGSMDFCVADAASDTLLVTVGYKKDGSAFYIGEPWVGIIKKNSVQDDGTLTERLLFMTEIPGDSDTSNEINIHNSFAEVGDTIKAKWVDDSLKDIKITATITANTKLKFKSSAAVTQAKIVYEIIKP